jgi:hypothetical protein
MRLHPSIKPLIGTYKQRVTYLNLTIVTTIFSRPIAVFTKQTKTPRNENLHSVYPEILPLSSNKLL